ncbi:hypothetical protein [Algoriphagus persicinus]|uniref:hypothetical protein n=1 Tax=Algoriphagus persicinus TaxID=3108754 RepID=UPI002B3A51E9|nr:hypothetical protein [Algoriphagus sp. E1-3-M2]MEB2786381.1 hypothetical protein [Algoriphagus sp. E1-3-M2]
MLKIYSGDGKSFYRLFFDDKVEYVNPLQYFRSRSINSSFYLMKDLTNNEFKNFPEEIKNKVLLKKAIETWETRYESINEEFLDEDFITLLSTRKKSEQLRLLKGKSLTSYAFSKFALISNSEFGFTFSRYTSEKLPGNLEKQQLPLLFELSEDESSVSIIGETSLKEGELKNVINHRKKIVANFLDKGNEWHCFYVTYKSLAGKESWNEGEPHYHYLSDKFGLLREDVVKGIIDGKVPSTPVHIGLKGYRNSKE